MPDILRGSLASGLRIATDEWQYATDQQALDALAPSLDVIIPYALWMCASPELRTQRPGRIGVRIESSASGEDALATLSMVALVAIEFPVFTDGRGYSLGRLLREQWHFNGEMRAVGDVQRDQIYYLLRCGFDAFELRADEDLPEALTAARDFSNAYQASVDQPLPLYRRRPPAAAPARGEEV